MRTIPRDLFNQANLLENLGHLYIKLEKIGKEEIMIDSLDDEDSFTMITDGYADTQSIEGVGIVVNDEEIFPYRSINSRERYSIYFMDNAKDGEFEVFTNEGDLSSEFLEFIKYPSQSKPEPEQKEKAKKKQSNRNKLR